LCARAVYATEAAQPSWRWRLTQRKCACSVVDLPVLHRSCTCVACATPLQDTLCVCVCAWGKLSGVRACAELWCERVPGVPLRACRCTCFVCARAQKVVGQGVPGQGVCSSCLGSPWRRPCTSQGGGEAYGLGEQWRPPPKWRREGSRGSGRTRRRRALCRDTCQSRSLRVQDAGKHQRPHC
jgi:hypothetical protein